MLLVLSSYFLWNDDFFRSNDSQPQGEIIAELTRKNQDVRHKLAGAVAWKDAHLKEPLHQLDSLFTGDHSRAEVSFQDGSRLLMDPKSLVTIKKRGAKTYLEVQSGAMSGVLSGKSELVLVRGEKVHELRTIKDQTKISISVEPSGQAKITVVSGEAELPAAGGMIRLKENEVARSTTEGKFEKSDQLSILLLRPSFDESLWKDEGDRLTFAWVTHPGLKDYAIEVSSSPHFEKEAQVFHKEPVSSDQLEIPFQSLPKGQPLFWRVLAKSTHSGSGIGDQELGLHESATSSVTLFLEKPPTLLAPAHQAEVMQSQLFEEASQFNQFRWEDPSPTSSFIVEVSQDASFQDIVARQEVRDAREISGRALLNDVFEKRLSLTESTLYWRVKADDPLRRPNAQWSEAFTLRVKSEPTELSKEDSPPIHPPVALESVPETLAQPDAEIAPKNRIPAAITVPAVLNTLPVQPEATPAPVEQLPIPKLKKDVQEYEISKLQKRDTTLGRFSLSVLHFLAGWVSSDAYAAEAGTASDLRASKLVKRKLPPITLSWQRTNPAHRYQIQMSKEEDFKAVLLNSRLSRPNYVWKNHQPGIFFWRVRVLKKENETWRMGGWSATGRIDVKVAPPGSLTETEFTYEKLSNQKNPPVVTLRWRKSPWAKAYEVQTSTERKFTHPLGQYHPKKNAQSVQFPKDGQYYWRVRILGDEQLPLGRFSKPYSLRVFGKEKESEPLRTLSSTHLDPAEPAAPTSSSLEANASQSQTIDTEQAPHAPWKFSLGLGYSFLKYQDTDYAAFNRMALTPKGALAYEFSPNGWSVGASAFMNALLISSGSKTEAVQFFGANLRVGKTLPILRSPWRVGLYGGSYYLTVFQSQSGQTGFYNMMGPQIYPTLSYQRADASVISGYFKYSPIASGAEGLTVPSFKSNELALGAFYTVPLPKQNRSWSLTLDFSKLHVNVQDVILINVFSSTLGVSYQW